MRVTDGMVQAALAVLERHGWDQDEELAAEVREALEAAVVEGARRNGHANPKHERAVRSRAKWLEQARKNAGE